MAAALWVLDYMFTLATYDCAGVNMETGVNQLDFISSYSPIGDDEQGHYTAKPEYYGMLAFSHARGDELLRTEIGARLPTVKAYATRRPGAPPIVTVINKSSLAVSFAVNIAGSQPSGHASVIRLAAPSLDAKTGITLAAAE